MRQRLLAVFGLLFALEANAGTLWQWTTPEGRTEVGTVPPPGVEAVPWSPDPPAPASPPTPPTPTPAAPAAPAAPAKGDPASSERCRKLQEEARELARSIQTKEAEIARLETEAERLAASEIAYQRVDCRNDVYAGDTHCEPEIFDRDREIARTDEKIARAREQLEELEQRASSIALAECDAPAKAR